MHQLEDILINSEGTWTATRFLFVINTGDLEIGDVKTKAFIYLTKLGRVTIWALDQLQNMLYTDRELLVIQHKDMSPILHMFHLYA